MGKLGTGARTTREQRSWFFYDWANSAYVTTVSTVLFAPWLTHVARQSACPGLDAEADCTTRLNVAGIPIAVGSLAPYTVTFATILAAITCIVVGAIADRVHRPVRLMGLLGWIGATAAMAMFFVDEGRWQLGVALLVIGNVCMASSTVVYDALLVRIAGPDERDRVSSRGWALGYLGGGILLALNLAAMTLGDSQGWDTGLIIRLNLVSAGLWWALFTIIPVVGLWRIVRDKPVVESSVGAVRGSIAQLVSTLKDLRNYPQTLLFLAAFLFFNDGIQTVIGAASLYGTEELGFEASQMIITILLVQFVAWIGALLFGRLAARTGAKKAVLLGVGLWTLVVGFAFFVPAGAFGIWLVCGVAIGLVLGGTQALSRSLYSQLVPHGREAEYFSLYQAMERGTSWVGMFAFGVMYQVTDSYRLAILVLIGFFVIGGALLSRLDVKRGIVHAGNDVPTVI